MESNRKGGQQVTREQNTSSGAALNQRPSLGNNPRSKQSISTPITLTPTQQDLKAAYMSRCTETRRHSRVAGKIEAEMRFCHVESTTGLDLLQLVYWSNRIEKNLECIHGLQLTASGRSTSPVKCFILNSPWAFLSSYHSHL
jgi:hypothetical protein